MSADDRDAGRPALTAAQQAVLARRLAARSREVIARADRARPIRASGPQEAFWFLQQLDPEAPTFGLSGVFRLSGKLDVPALRAAVDALVERHEILRATLVPHDGVPMIRIRPPLQGVLIVEDASEADDPQIAARADADVRAPFDLQAGPLFRASLLRRSEAEHFLLVAMHHAVGDDWSWAIFEKELVVLYSAFARGEPSPLAALTVQYADYAVWQRDRVSAQLEEQLRYWRAQLSGVSPLELPLDQPRRAASHSPADAVSIAIPTDVTASLAMLARARGATLNMALTAAFGAFLSRYTGQDDIAIGCPFSGRPRPELESIMGLFINSLAIRVSVADDPTFTELLERVAEVHFGAFANADVPFHTLVDALGVARDPAQNPIYQVMFAFYARRPPGQADDGVAFVRLAEGRKRSTVLDLVLMLSEDGDGVRGELEYNAHLFDRSTIVRMRDRWLRFLAELAAHPGQRISAMAFTGASEGVALVPAKSPHVESSDTLHALFEAQAARTPDAVAVVHDAATLTYRALNERANQLAHRLRAEGVGPDVPVAFCLERTEAPIVAILGILKAGGCYVPIDPGYPEERRAWIVADSRARVVLANRSLAGPLGPVPVIVLDDDTQLAAQARSNPAIGGSPDQLAYVIYTSGSTGRPKGTLIPHRNVVRLMRATEAWFRFGADDRWTVFHSFAFDFSVWEVWGALLYGGRAIVVPYMTSRSPEDVLELICAHGVTVLNQTPSAFRQLMHAATSASSSRSRWSSLPLRWVIFGGEALDLRSLAPWFEQLGDTQPTLVNMYGITETTVHVTRRPVCHADTRSARSVIGEPIPDLTLHVLDRDLRPAPVDIVGELYVGGAGLSRGYLGLPGLTAERFVPDPFSPEPGARMYRSGDLGRRLADGDVEYLGRADFQIKIRGFRIECGEIESSVASHPAVRDVVVIAREDVAGDQRLVAYVIPRDAGAPPTGAQLRDHLRATLPDYMIPSAVVVLDAFPLTANGKLDRAALPPPASESVAPAAEDRPRNAIEDEVAKIWSELLRLDHVGVDDDFFDLGGHSLLLTQLTTQIERVFGVSLSLRTIFESATVRGVAAAVTDELAGEAQRSGDLEGLLAEIEGLSPEEVAALLGEDREA